jgi:hypothetical protein
MSLAEVLVGAAVLMIGLVALLAIAPAATGFVWQAGLQTTATFLAHARIEQMRTHTWSAVEDALGGAGATGATAVARWEDEDYGTIALEGTAYPDYRRVTRIVDCSLAPCGTLAPVPSRGTLRQIVVVVAFSPPAASGQVAARGESVVLTTLIARRP